MVATKRFLNVGRCVTAACFLAVTLSPSYALAEDDKASGALAELMAAVKDSKPILDVNLRWEYAKINAFQHSHGATARTRFGVATGTFHGWKGLLEGVNTASPKPSGYFDAVETNDGPQSVVADPERTAVNRAWLAFSKEEWGGLEMKGGRQRIKLDDDRWIGNVGWRQNEQTYDAARVKTNLGMEKLLVQYIYAWQVNRIFGDQGGAGTRDFGPRSHMLNVSYAGGKAARITGFAYLIDPNQANFRAFGSATYGGRVKGTITLSDDLAVPYQASYAYQHDWGNNQVSYDAHYALAEAGLKVKGLATVSAGYEHLGSDTDARVVTPFSTAHKFNGFADAFLNNGGVRGLRDLYVSIAPAIPCKGLKLKFIFHQFWDDQGGDNLGEEYNIVSTYKWNEHIGFLWKFAYFDGGKTRSPATRTRSILQTTLRF